MQSRISTTRTERVSGQSDWFLITSVNCNFYFVKKKKNQPIKITLNLKGKIGTCLEFLNEIKVVTQTFSSRKEKIELKT